MWGLTFGRSCEGNQLLAAWARASRGAPSPPTLSPGEHQLLAGWARVGLITLGPGLSLCAVFRRLAGQRESVLVRAVGASPLLSGGLRLWTGVHVLVSLRGFRTSGGWRRRGCRGRRPRRGRPSGGRRGSCRGGTGSSY